MRVFAPDVLLSSHAARVAAAVLAFALPAAPVFAQTSSPLPASPQDPLRVTVPTVMVTAQKEPGDRQKVPVSVTAVTAQTIRDAGIVTVSDAATFAPNVYFTEFTARKLSTARFRGISSSPGNPGVTTFIDGVPQFNTNSSSLDLLDVDQIEFVRGPQSALFGRNTLGGLINITSARPTTGAWTGFAELPIANYGGVTVRGGASGGIVEGQLAGSVSFAHSSRDGYTVNVITDNDLDDRSSFSGKGQLLWTPRSNWEARLILSGERARDGDYALHDLGSLRQTPFEATRDLEGRTDRDIFSTTILARHTRDNLVFTSTTGIVRWTTEDTTDLDYTPLSFVTRDNTEKDLQFTQEFRVSTAPDASVPLAGGRSMIWQAGVFFFTQGYEQRAVNRLSGLPMLPVVVDLTLPEADLDDAGFGLFGQGTVRLTDQFNVIGGLRVDYESKSASLQTFSDPPFLPSISVEADESYANVSPQIAATYQWRPETMFYGTFSGGFKAGGFNPASPAGFEAYDQERTWLIEGGVKTGWMDGRVATNASLFTISWDDLQLNVPDLTLPAQFYISNAGSARSTGVEFEAIARPLAGLDVFGALGITSARFGNDAVSNGVPVGDNRIANTPDYTFSLGGQYARDLNRWGATAYGRVELAWYGAFQYDDTNTERQEAYSLAHLRAGVRGRLLFVEGWVRNAFDTKYIPVAFPYPDFAPSGFIGEMGAPRTFGITAGVRF